MLYFTICFYFEISILRQWVSVGSDSSMQLWNYAMLLTIQVLDWALYVIL